MKSKRITYYKSNAFVKTSLTMRLLRSELKRLNRFGRRIVAQADRKMLKIIGLPSIQDNPISGNSAGK